MSNDLGGVENLKGLTQVVVIDTDGLRLERDVIR
jgi:hypothetical protein